MNGRVTHERSLTVKLPRYKYIHKIFNVYVTRFDKTSLIAAKYTYRIAGFLREDFNIAIGLIRNIKNREVFVMLHFVTR